MNNQFQTHDKPIVPEWWNDPARKCAGTPDELWFPLDTNRGRRNFSRDSDMGRARALCEACPFLIECADDARLRGDRHGFRAGVLLSSKKPHDRLEAAKRAWRQRRGVTEPEAISA